MSASASTRKLVVSHDTTADAKPMWRVFNTEYQARILDEGDATTEPSGIVACRRREGLHSSYVVDWWRAGALGRIVSLPPMLPGPSTTDPAKRVYDQRPDR